MNTIGLALQQEEEEKERPFGMRYSHGKSSEVGGGEGEALWDKVFSW